MLWYKAWIETRWPFLIGLTLLTGMAAMVVLLWPTLVKTVGGLPQGSPSMLTEELRKTVASYHDYVRSQWFAKNLLQVWTGLAIILGAGGLVSETSRGHALYTLSLPVTRRRVCGSRAAVGAAELALLGLLPSIAISCLSPAVGQSFPLVEAVMRALTLVLGGMLLYGLSILLSSLITSRVRVISLGLGAAVALAILPSVIPFLARHGIYHVMSGSAYSSAHEIPWRGLTIILGLTVALIYSSIRIVENRDF